MKDAEYDQHSASGQHKPAHWRGAMGEVASLCGDDVAHALMEHYAGTRFYVPAKFKPDSVLCKLSDDQAERFIEHYGRAVIYIPSNLMGRPTRGEMFDAIEALVDEGLNTADIANRLGITHTNGPCV